MKTVGSAIKEAIAATPKMTITKLAERIDVSYDVLSNMCTGRTKPTTDVVDKIRRVLRLPATWPYDVIEASSKQLQRLAPMPTGRIKIAGPIGAGVAPNHASDADDSLNVPLEFARESHSGLVAQGDSMMPFIHPGDVLIFRDSPLEKIGKIVCAKVDNEPFPVAKKLVFEDGSFRLRSLNPAYGDMSARSIQMIGYLIGIVGAEGLLAIGPDYAGIDEVYIQNHLSSRLPH